MANLITHSLSFSKESIDEFFITPLFIENDIRDLITIRADIKSSEKLDFFDNLEKITKASAVGTAFTASTGVTLTQKTLTVSDMKAQVEQNGKAFLNQVKQALLKQGWQQNDISDTLLEEIILTIFMDGLKADLQRQIWLGDTLKELRTADAPTGVADVHYNVYDGFWPRIIKDIDSVVIPAAQFVDLNSTTFLDVIAVKEVDTVTLTGTDGTANITINGTAFLATFATDLTTTATNFVTSHATTILAKEDGLVVTSSGADVIVTAGIAGCALTTAIANVSLTLDGTIAQTTANTKTGAIKTDGAQTAFKTCYEAMPSVLKKNKNLAKFYVTASIADNYRTTLESASAGSESAYTALIDGVKVLAYRGIPINEMLDWDDRIDTDGGDCRPHRILLSIAENLVFGTDGVSDDMDIEEWFEKKDQTNNFRVEYKAGTQYVHEEFIVAAFG